MSATKHHRIRRVIASLCGVVVVAGVAAGCAGFRTERDGRQAGDAICDIKSAYEAKAALDDLQKWVDKAEKTTGRPVDEDVRDIKENLSDLAEHAANGNSALAQQDVAVIRRNVQSVVRVTQSRTQRFYEGVDQGLSNCTD